MYTKYHEIRIYILKKHFPRRQNFIARLQSKAINFYHLIHTDFVNAHRLHTVA